MGNKRPLDFGQMSVEVVGGEAGSSLLDISALSH